MKEYIVSYAIGRMSKRYVYIKVITSDFNKVLTKAWKINNKTRSKLKLNKISFRSFVNRSKIMKSYKVSWWKYIKSLFS